MKVECSSYLHVTNMRSKLCRLLHESDNDLGKFGERTDKFARDSKALKPQCRTVDKLSAPAATRTLVESGRQGLKVSYTAVTDSTSHNKSGPPIEESRSLCATQSTSYSMSC